MMRRNLPSLFLFLAAMLPALLPAQVGAASLVNINTADSVTLQTLSGIGPSKAQAIIDYRTQQAPFAAIEDIMNVSGIGTATYNNIKASITVGDTVTQTQLQPSQTQATSTPVAQTTVQSSGGLGPPSISARITVDTTAIVGAGTVFVGSAYGTKDEPLVGARYVWNFGDGGVGEGPRIIHTYAYPGTYDVQLSVGYNYSSATARLVVPAVAADIALIAEGDGSLTVANYSDYDLDIGFWALVQGTTSASSGQAGPFTLPEGTVVLRGKGVRFAPLVLGFAGGMPAALYYPNGALAAAAYAGEHSPLRGERVDLSAPKQAVSGYSKLPEAGPSRAKPATAAISAATSANVAAAASAPGAAEAQWSYFLGLAGVIAIGAVGAYYARIPTDTSALVDEFDIE